MNSTQKLQKHFVVPELERQLQQDQRGTFRDRINNELSAWETDLERQKRSGLSRMEFFEAERLLSSVRIAGQTIRRTWNALHTS